MMLKVVDVDIAYGALRVVKQLGFGLADGEIGCLLGPSGCGKTTLLRAIAGFEPIRAGSIALGGEMVSRPGFVLPPEQRRVGMIFQDFAIFPHLSIEDNVAFGLRGWRRSERDKRVAGLLALVGLASYHDAYPHQLSGGQLQRVALARALAPRPRLLLMDEPFSSLDVALREGLAAEVREVLKEEGITALMVTHDQNEAFALADQIGVMNQGRLHQWSSGYDLYHRPMDRFVAGFIGKGVLFPGRVQADGTILTELGTLVGSLPEGCGPDCEVEVLLRPDDVIDEAVSGDEPQGMVVDRLFRGAEFLYSLRLPSGREVMCVTHSHHQYRIGEQIPLRLGAEHVVVFPRTG